MSLCGNAPIFRCPFVHCALSIFLAFVIYVMQCCPSHEALKFAATEWKGGMRPMGAQNGRASSGSNEALTECQDSKEGDNGATSEEEFRQNSGSALSPSLHRHIRAKFLNAVHCQWTKF